MERYFGFADRSDLMAQFSQGYSYGYEQNEVDDASFPKDEEILFAWYQYEDYSGDAFVLFEQNGTLYEVHGGHCSCYGLEGQWDPEETTWEFLRDKGSPTYSLENDQEAYGIFRDLIKSRAG